MWRAAIFHPRGSAQRGRRRRERRKSSSEAEEWVSAGYKTKSRDWPRYEESGRDSCDPIRENPAALQPSHQTCTHKLSAVFMVNIVYPLTESSALSQCVFKHVQTLHLVCKDSQDIIKYIQWTSDLKNSWSHHQVHLSLCPVALDHLTWSSAAADGAWPCPSHLVHIWVWWSSSLNM